MGKMIDEGNGGERAGLNKSVGEAPMHPRGVEQGLLEGSWEEDSVINRGERGLGRLRCASGVVNDGVMGVRVQRQGVCPTTTNESMKD